MAALRNLVAAAALLVIPLAFYLAWNKHIASAWLLMVGYAALLGYFVWSSRRR
ncbi:MAG: hypothetical protein N2Z21_04205 [Candidatus Sumerlaeaceae bacterium]|nr:hypothetical protein [Candidatus Sumerlaeaceae bacterium]